MTIPKAFEDKMMAAMNGPGDVAKLSPAAARALKKATLSKALEASKLAATRRKVAPQPVAKKASKPPIKKAAASKKAVRKTMKTGKKRGR
jgi:hypothetical protein